MDTATKVKTAGEGIKSGFLTPNEARAKFDFKPVAGGDTPYLQQQNYSLAALDKRDRGDDPFASSKPVAPSPDKPAADGEPGDVSNDNIGEDGVNADEQTAAITDVYHQQLENWRQHHAEAA